jgi:pimeloyl-ACP methyl ester carboxylesterase
MAAPPPIIIVPGLMGTRLVDPASGRKIWDPLPSRGRGFAARVARLADPTPLAPDPTLDNIPMFYPRVTSAEAARARTIPGFANLIYEFYGRLALDLTGPAFQRLATTRIGGAPRVYVCGYDWRRSNALSAHTLQRVVETALAQTGARQVILVAHSMGGLVSRCFCRFGRVGGRPAEQAVAALVLLASPTHGAPQAYRQLKLGLDPVGRPGADGIMGALLWDAVVAGRHRDLIRSFQSVFELLPTAHFCRRNPGWLRFDTAAAGIPDASDADRLYSNPHTGLTGGLSMSARLGQRRAFDRGLGLYMPSPTHVLYSAGQSTESAYDLVRATLLDRTPLGAGDGTVPAFSGMADGCRLGAAGTRTRLPALEHKAIPVDSRVIAGVMAIVLRTATPRPARELEAAPVALAA